MEVKGREFRYTQHVFHIALRVILESMNLYLVYLFDTTLVEFRNI